VRPALTTARQSGTRLTYPGGWQAELTWVFGWLVGRCQSRAKNRTPWLVTHSIDFSSSAAVTDAPGLSLAESMASVASSVNRAAGDGLPGGTNSDSSLA